MNRLLDHLKSDLKELSDRECYGTVTKILGLMAEVTGLGEEVTIGSMCELKPRGRATIPCEVIGFEKGSAQLMPFGTLEGVGPGCRVCTKPGGNMVYPHDGWLGRVLDGLGRPLDDQGPVSAGSNPIPLRNAPPPAHRRQRIGSQLDLGVRAVNSFLPVCEGQRMGIFSGSGVGKSVLLSMMARYTEADISVVGLIGERGREVQEFLEDDLGKEGLSRSVVIVATGDEPALMRRQAAYLTLAVSEYFRMQGKNVLCLMDSLTRFAMAQREIGLSAGEPPTSKGYPPTTFGELARLLERAGPGPLGEGTITGIFSVLVEGDDTNEPISDAVRGIVDGHIVMDRSIADRGRYPAIDVLKSVSRSLPGALSKERNELLRQSKHLISTYEDMAELIRLGAYRKGSDPGVDRALETYPDLEAFLAQDKEDVSSIAETFSRLQRILQSGKQEISANISR